MLKQVMKTEQRFQKSSCVMITHARLGYILLDSPGWSRHISQARQATLLDPQLQRLHGERLVQLHGHHL